MISPVLVLVKAGRSGRRLVRIKKRYIPLRTPSHPGFAPVPFGFNSDLSLVSF